MCRLRAKGRAPSILENRTPKQCSSGGMPIGTRSSAGIVRDGADPRKMGNCVFRGDAGNRNLRCRPQKFRSSRRPASAVHHDGATLSFCVPSALLMHGRADPKQPSPSEWFFGAQKAAEGPIKRVEKNRQGGPVPAQRSARNGDDLCKGRIGMLTQPDLRSASAITAARVARGRYP
jgi:hypothetical protein